MKQIVIAVIATVFLDLLPVLGADSAAVPNSESLDGRYAARIDPPPNIYDLDYLSVFLKETGQVVSRILLGGYARFPLDAEPENLKMLWSPNSATFALMLRDTKRSWSTSVYSIEKTECRKVELPSASRKALSLFPSWKGYRVLREEPTKWLDIDHLLVRASGGIENGQEFRRYEVDITYSISARSITDAILIETRPYNG